MGNGEIERLVGIYVDVTGVADAGRLRQHLRELPDLGALTSTADEVLREAAHMLCERRGWGFPVGKWGAAVSRVQNRQQSPPGPAQRELLAALQISASRHHRLLAADVGAYIDMATPGVTTMFSPALIEPARRRLLERAVTAEFEHGAFARRRARWSRDAGRVTGTVPVINADDIEEVVVHLLALTRPEAQFSYTPAHVNRVFAGGSHGYHRDDTERVYVTGLSDVLDTLNEHVQEHREGMGGRVLISNARVVCADCRQVLAWIGSLQDDRPPPASH